ncbi:Glycosyl transferase family 2 [Bacillus sp. OV194]|nr:Glycosyl transferase family 2 [Bacillus sp. OV194]
MVSVITCTIRDSCMDNIFDNYKNQNYDQKELIIVLNQDSMCLKKWREKAKNYDNVSVFQVPQQTSLGNCINFAVGHAKYDIIANFEDDDYYAPAYLQHSLFVLNAMKADVIGKTSVYIYLKNKQVLAVFNPGNENQYVNDQNSFGKQYLQGGTLVFYKAILDLVRFPDQIKEVDRIFCRDCVKAGLRVYSTTKENFTYVRNDDQEQHTWKVPVDVILSISQFITKTDDFKPIVSKF